LCVLLKTVTVIYETPKNFSTNENLFLQGNLLMKKQSLSLFLSFLMGLLLLPFSIANADLVKSLDLDMTTTLGNYLSTGSAYYNSRTAHFDLSDWQQALSDGGTITATFNIQLAITPALMVLNNTGSTKIIPEHDATGNVYYQFYVNGPDNYSYTNGITTNNPTTGNDGRTDNDVTIHVNGRTLNNNAYYYLEGDPIIIDLTWTTDFSVTGNSLDFLYGFDENAMKIALNAYGILCYYAPFVFPQATGTITLGLNEFQQPPTAVTPEPASMLIVGMGLALLPLSRRLRKK
jgi:hypothetical protein